MRIGEKIANLLNLALDELLQAYQSKSMIFESMSHREGVFNEWRPLLAFISQNGIADRVFSAAAIAEIFDTIKDSILADGNADASEFKMAFEVLQPIIHDYTWIDGYERFFPLVMANEIPVLLGQWEKDNSPLGGCFDDGAIECPFLKIVMMAALISQDISVYDSAMRVMTVVAKLIVSAGGVGYQEEQYLLSQQERIGKYRNVLEGTIHTRKQSENTQGAVEGDDGVATISTLEERHEVVLEGALKELDALVGLPEVKQEVKKLVNFLKVQQQRAAAGLPIPSQSLHFVFMGNPGTGKTTVARILSKILFGFRVLQKNLLVEADRPALIGGYLGQTAIKTSEVIDRALDGVLFIDEAYTLTSLGSKSANGDMYGDEAVGTLLKRMEDLRNRLVVIVAGYPQLMEEFLASNPGLESRFTRFINFGDYHVADMCAIFSRMCLANSYCLTQEARGNLAIFFNRAFSKRDEKFGNARFVRNAYEKALGRHADRLAFLDSDITRDALVTIEAEDLPFEMVPGIPKSFDTSNSRWRGKCPGCGKIADSGIGVIGKKVRCKCGAVFVYPAWNLVPDSLCELRGFVVYERDVDLTGVASL